jgi:hypothetical protein
MVLILVPVPLVLALVNHDSSASGAIPIGVVCVVSIWYSWQKWQRHPEETQSIAFMGLDRRTRWAAYRSMWRGSALENPVVLTIVESMYAHLRRSSLMVLATMCAAAVMGVALVQVGGGTYAQWVSIGIVALLALAIAQQRWLLNRAAVVIAQSRGAVPRGGV